MGIVERTCTLEKPVEVQPPQQGIFPDNCVLSPEDPLLLHQEVSLLPQESSPGAVATEPPPPTLGDIAATLIAPRSVPPIEVVTGKPEPALSLTSATLIEPWLGVVNSIPHSLRNTLLGQAHELKTEEITDPRVIEKLIVYRYGFNLKPSLLRGRKYKFEGSNGDAIDMSRLEKIFDFYASSGNWHVGVRLHPGPDNPNPD